VKWLVGTFAAIASLFAALFFRNKSKQQKEHLRTLTQSKDAQIRANEAGRPLDFADVKETQEHVKDLSENNDYSGMFDPSKLRNRDL